MTAFRALLFGLGIVLLLGAVVAALVHVPEPILGAHCDVRMVGGPVCPDTRDVRHVKIAIGMAVVAVGLLGGSLLGRRRS
ncbi:hypothetical protein LN042_32100 [Kitasatospora sp. RB6PN24]|uniref:hypothetical protein n=1 Tax=Kitasatospora humi TaxID=2893891 RepID=UPI001E40A2A0|nr:hypothetical protein [Kitasatospora humi]MCC9311656.1 hypothetical protein [Kitasatospora humi]